MLSEPCIILTTTSTLEESQRLAEVLVERHLAACVSTLPAMHAVYRWKGNITRETEFQVIIKTSKDRVAAIEECFRHEHTYDLPEFIVLEVTCGADYFSWMASALESSATE